MIRLRVLKLLDEQNHTKYWLHNQMDLSYKNLSSLINNETISIRFDNIERLCKVLNCTPNDLFEIVDELEEND